MSAGTVTPGTGLSGYSGGFVGSFSGTLTGLDNQITLKNCFGNCLGKEGNLKPIGNSSQYPGEGNEAAMAEIALNTLRDVSGKLFEMFGVNLDAGLEAEAGRYADWITISYDTPLEKDIPLLKEAQTATPGVTAAISVQSGYLTDGESLQLSRKNETARSLTCQGTLTVSDGQSFFHKPVTILLKASAQARDRLMDAIAETLTESSDGWTVMDLAAYGRLPGKTAATGEAALQNAVNLAIGEAAGSPLPGDRARLEIVLRSIGVDSAKLYQVNSNIPIDNAAKLKNVSASGLTAYGYYSAPWILMAELQGNVELTQDQRTALLYLLRDSMGEDGMFAAEYNGVVYPDVDTAGITLAALASLYESDETAKLIVDTILAGLPSVQSASGSFGSANTDAMVLLGLSAMGIDPLTDSRFMKNGCSVAAGLLTYVNAAENGFQFGGAENALATEQGFRALVALAQRGETAGAYQFYDFSGVPVQPGRATGEGEVEKPDEPDTDQTITVSFMLKSDSEIWIPRTQVTVKKGSTVYHAFVKALEDAGLTSVGAENGYVKSITKDGVTLSEFDKGPDSGWLYKVDGRVPTVGLTSYPLSGGENILWYYTRDWTADPDAGVIDGGKTDEKQDQVLTPDMTAGQDGSGRASVSTGELSRAAEQAAKTGGAVVIAPKGADQVEKLTVTLPGDAAAKLAEAGAELRVETKAADVTLSQAGLRQLSQAAKEITVETECLEGGGIALSLRADGNEVSPVDGGVKVVLPVKNGQVVVLLEDGGETVVKKSLVEDGKAYALLPSGATLKVVDRPVSYGDVTAGQWFASAVQFAAGRGLMAGVTESQFAPDLNMDRGMLVTVLHRLEEEPRGDGPAFGDVLKDSYYAEAVAWAAEQGIVSGMAPNVFAPADPVTREQLAAFLHRYAKLAGLDVADRADLGKFADAAAVSDWAKESLEWAVSVGLLAGKDSGLLDPTGNATRAEVAIILQRLIALLVK